MTSSKAKDISRAIATLSDAELDEVSKAIAARKSIGGKADKTSTVTTRLQPDVLLVLEAIAEVMTSNGADATPVGLLAKVPGMPAFKKKVPVVMQTLASSRLKRNETRAVLRNGIGMLYSVLTDQGLEATSRRVMDHIHRFPAQMDKHFPGYAAAGLLALTVRAHAKNTNEEPD